MKKKTIRILLAVSLCMVLIGSIVGGLIQTSFGTVDVQKVSWVTDDGATLSALLYIPKRASAEEPLPAVVSCHGWNNTAEVQGMNCIELSRRGYVVIAVDAYGHGDSTFPVGTMTDDDMADGVEDGTVATGADGSALVADMGVYSALQYLGTLPFVDTENIGMVGHSMGGGTIQSAALRAFKLHEEDPDVIVPKAVLPTSQSFTLDGDKGLLEDYPVNIGAVYGRRDEWAQAMWGVAKGLDVNKSENTAAVFGFDVKDGITYGAYYEYGSSEPIDRSEAAKAAQDGAFRVIYQPLRTHPGVHNDSAAASYVVDFFGITLKAGAEEPIDAGSQIWLWKDIFGMISLLGFFLFMMPMAAILLRTKFFGSICRRPYEGSVLTGAKNKVVYALLFLLGLVPAALLFYPLMGYPIAIKATGRYVGIPLPVNDYFQMPIMNGLVLFNLACGATALLLFWLVYRFYSKKSGMASGPDTWGIRLPLKDIGKAFLLGVIVFLSAYMLLVLADFFFGVDFRFFTLSIKTLTPAKWLMYLKYLPFFAFFYLINSLTLNVSTSLAGKREWLNYTLCALSNVGGVLVLHILDYLCLYITGVKMFLTTPWPAEQTSALAGVLAWGLLFILPIAGIMARFFYKRSGNIWVGGFINTFAVTLFALSNTAVGIGMI